MVNGHFMSTSGGIDEQGKWVEVNCVSYDYLHREWQRQLFVMLSERVWGRGINALLDRLEQEYPRGIVAYWEAKPVKTAKGLAKYLIKYVVSPPIAVSRIIEYDGQTVTYCRQDHKSNQQERASVSAIELIRLLVQHILPKRFQRVRYYGLHAVCLRKKIVEIVRRAIGAMIQQAFYFANEVMLKLGWRVKIKGKFGRDPMLCERCGREMILWRIWTPGYGVLYYLPDDTPEWIEAKSFVKPQVTLNGAFVFKFLEELDEY
jgi:hypothetical protein